jgi:quercetin dioxygenase-like cupin family protein
MTPAPGIEKVAEGDVLLAWVIRAGPLPEQTEFLTPEDFNQQVGFIVYARGTEIPRHFHLPVERRVIGTTEVIFVRRGRCDAEIYGETRKLVATVSLAEGDIIIMLRGGHGFRVHEDTVLIEVKQGPYSGSADKERF